MLHAKPPHAEELLRTVVLCTDDHLWRQALKAALETQTPIVIEAPNEQELVRSMQQIRPQIAIVDSFIAFHDGSDSLHRIIRSCKATQVILIAARPMHAQIIAAIQAGAAGFIAKSDCMDLMRAITRDPEPQLYLSPAVVHVLQDSPAHSAYREDPLSRREREVLQLVAEGGTTKRIASQLCISTKTVESHVLRMKRKLNTRETAGLVRYALDSGLSRAK